MRLFAVGIPSFVQANPVAIRLWIVSQEQDPNPSPLPALVQLFPVWNWLLGFGLIKVYFCRFQCCTEKPFLSLSPNIKCFLNCAHFANKNKRTRDSSKVEEQQLSQCCAKKNAVLHRSLLLRCGCLRCTGADELTYFHLQSGLLWWCVASGSGGIGEGGTTWSKKKEKCLLSIVTLGQKLWSQTEDDVVVQAHSAWGNLGARAEYLHCRLTSAASCHPCSSCTAPSRPPPGRARRPPPPGRTPWWPSQATASHGPASKPQGLKSAEQKREAKAIMTFLLFFFFIWTTLSRSAEALLLKWSQRRREEAFTKKQTGSCWGYTEMSHTEIIKSCSIQVCALAFVSVGERSPRGFWNSKEKEKSRNGMLTFMILHSSLIHWFRKLCMNLVIPRLSHLWQWLLDHCFLTKDITCQNRKTFTSFAFFPFYLWAHFNA